MLTPTTPSEDYEGRDEALKQTASRNCKSIISCQGGMGDDIERASIQSGDECYEKEAQLKPVPQTSLELKRTASRASNALDRIFTTRSIRDPGPPPDGGLKAWTQVACGWIVIFTTWGWVNSYGAFQTYYTLHLGAPASTISWIGTVQNWFCFFIGAFSGRALDAGFYLPVLLLGCTLQILGIFLMSLCTSFWQLMLTQGVLTGLGGGIFFTPSLGLVATYFSRRRAFAIGIMTTGNSVGGAIYPVIVRELLPQIGFAWTTRVLGFLNLGLLALVVAFMRPRLPPRTSGPLVDFTAFREAPYAFFISGIFFVVWAIYYTFYYVASFGVEIVDMSYSPAALLVILINIIGLPARIIPPYFADKLGQLNLMVPIVFCLAIVSYCWIPVNNVSGLYTFTAMYGLVSAALQCLIPSTVASITPDLNVVGTRLGMAFSTFSFAALTGPPIGGALQSALGGQYTGASAWAASVTILAGVLILLARVAKGGWRLQVKS